YSAIDFRTSFKAEQSTKASNGRKDLRRITSIPHRMARAEEESGKGLYMRTCCVRFVSNKQFSDRAK
ncbi:hypothetical protein ALC57_07133, partial [Trachymyrmex cornetzi]